LGNDSFQRHHGYENDFGRTAQLRKSPAKGGWSYVIWPESAAFFETRGLVKVRGTIDGFRFSTIARCASSGGTKIGMVRTLHAKHIVDVLEGLFAHGAPLNGFRGTQCFGEKGPLAQALGLVRKGMLMARHQANRGCCTLVTPRPL
jgi:hypothetical protein